MQTLEFKTTLSIFFFFLSIFLITNQGSIQTSDGTDMFLVTKNIVENQSILLNFNEEPDIVEEGKRNKQYSKYGLGTSILAIPFYCSGKIIAWIMDIPSEFSTKFTVSLMGAILTALMCALIYKFSLKLKFQGKDSFLLSLIYGIGTMAWVYSEDLYSTTFANLLLFSSIYFVFSFSEEKTIANLFWSGFLLGMAVLTRFDVVITVPIIFVYLLFNVKKNVGSIKILLKNIFVFLIPCLCGICVVLIKNYICFGSFFSSGYRQSFSELFNENILAGLYRSFISPGRSFFFTNPILIFSVFGFIKLYRHKKTEGIFLIAITVIYALFYAKIGRKYYFGGPVWGPRYLLMILPYCVIVLGFLLTEFRKCNKQKMRAIFGAILFISVLIQVSSVSVNPMRFFYEMKDKYPLDYNEKITLNPRYSLIIGQWKSLSTVLSNIDDIPRLKKMVSMAIKKRKFTDSSTSDILQNALAINTLNFWWFYLYLLGYPLWLIYTIVLSLVASVVISGSYVVLLLNRNCAKKGIYEQ